jgi:hypothetical protein
MTDAEALVELAAAIYHLKEAEKKADSDEVAEKILSGLEDLDERVDDILMEIGEQEYGDDESS